MIIRQHTGRAGRRGNTLITVSILLGTMTVLTLIFMRVGQRVSQEQVASLEATHATLLAEAGVSEAIEALRSGESGNIAGPDDPAYLGGGVLWVEATDLGDGRTQLDSMAMKDGGRAALRVEVEGGGGGDDDGDEGASDAFFSMLFSNKSLQLKQNVEIDSWDSSLGTYASQAVNDKSGFTYAGTAGGAASNANIQLDNNVHVFGDVHAGPGGTLNPAASAYVSGSTTPSEEKVPLAQIPVPFILPSGIYAVANSATNTINPGKYHFAALTQGKFSKLKIIGPATIVVDSYVTGASATLEVDCTNGPVTIYDTGIWSVDKNYRLEPTPGSPIDAAFLISSPGTVQFDQGSKIAFGFYAPNATIQVDQTAEVWGALVADQINVDLGTKFHFDENLKGFHLPWVVPDSVLGKEDDEVAVLSWSKIEFPVQAFKTNRRAPFELLGVQKSELRAPAEAWEEPEVKQ